MAGLEGLQDRSLTYLGWGSPPPREAILLGHKVQLSKVQVPATEVTDVEELFSSSLGQSPHPVSIPHRLPSRLLIPMHYGSSQLQFLIWRAAWSCAIYNSPQLLPSFKFRHFSFADAYTPTQRQIHIAPPSCLHRQLLLDLFHLLFCPQGV